jgi:AmmeMemoRadiSam system protein A
MTAGSLAPGERKRLLDVARRAIRARLSGEPPPGGDDTPRLRELGGAFVTLRRRDDGELRGCVGYVEPHFPLVEAVARAAVAAALEDGRFDRVTEAELPSLAIEISALAGTSPIRPEDVEIGTHGLIIRCAGHSGLLLPQVPREHGWNRDVFLAETCRKAGLPRDAWKRADVELLGFTAEVFGEED